jgi:hypothetical protein
MLNQSYQPTQFPKYFNSSTSSKNLLALSLYYNFILHSIGETSITCLFSLHLHPDWPYQHLILIPPISPHSLIIPTSVNIFIVTPLLNNQLKKKTHNSCFHLWQPFSATLPWRNPWNNFQVTGSPSTKIIKKGGSGFNLNKDCKMTLISAIYNMKIYW